MPSFEEARTTILASVRPLGSEHVPLAEAVGRVLASDVAAPWDLPRWDNSAMDGFAVRAADCEGEVTLRITQFLPAGTDVPAQVLPGTAARIMTGAPVPPGGDTVVPVEDAEVLPGKQVKVRGPLRRGAHVRRRGEDFRQREAVLRAGTVLTAADVSVLAAFARPHAHVLRRPRVAILSTGDELLAAGEPPMPGRIFDVNGPALAAAVREAGGDPVPLGIARDDRDALRRLLADGLEADALVTTAGAWTGDRDHVREVLAELGVRQVFWKVEVKPGKPMSFGLQGDRPAFSLPGNPVAALLVFETLVRPALLRMGGHAGPPRPTVRALFQETLTVKPGRVTLLRVRLERRGGEVHAASAGPHDTGILRSSVLADGVLVVPEEGAALVPGTPVDVLVLRPGFEARTSAGA